MYPVTQQLLGTTLNAFVTPLRQFTPAEIQCANQAELLHQSASVSHVSDDVLRTALSNGIFPSSHLTATDFRNNRVLRGPCPQCLAGLPRFDPLPQK